MAGEMRSIKREEGPGSASGAENPGGSKGSRSRGGWSIPGRARVGVPVPRAGAGPGNGRTGSRSAQALGRRPGGRPRAARCCRSRPTTRGRRLPPPGRGRAPPGPAAWPGHTTGLTTSVHTSSRASESSPGDHPGFLRRLMMKRRLLACQVIFRTLVTISLSFVDEKSGPARPLTRRTAAASRHANVATRLLGIGDEPAESVPIFRQYFSQRARAPPIAAGAATVAEEISRSFHKIRPRW
jgi:hypothetical protein